MKNLILLLLFIPLVSFGQTTKLEANLPFSEISEYPTEFSQANIVSRMIEGLGYRYYWATKSLTEKDLNYKSSDDARSTLQIIEHIYSLTEMISSSFKNNEFEFTLVKGTYNELREKTLLNLKYIQGELKSNPDFSQLSLRFERGGTKMEFPFWNQINGPISDALWHCGQVVMNRRASGNPLQSGVNVFIGKTSY
ncbi:MAG: hypothetical protein P8K72_04840 [Flavobacteriaceae bacterium]|jgi:hypothetical protein|nr:hypothetical protein [Flavobacteriaceae bacterium]